MQQRGVVFALLALAYAGPAAAQTIRASIYGTVMDPTGSGIPNATVRAIHVATSSELNYVTDERGNYDFPRLVKFGEERVRERMKTP